MVGVVLTSELLLHQGDGEDDHVLSGPTGDTLLGFECGECFLRSGKQVLGFREGLLVEGSDMWDMLEFPSFEIGYKGSLSLHEASDFFNSFCFSHLRLPCFT